MSCLEGFDEQPMSLTISNKYYTMYLELRSALFKATVKLNWADLNLLTKDCFVFKVDSTGLLSSITET